MRESEIRKKEMTHYEEEIYNKINNKFLISNYRGQKVVSCYIQGER